MNSKPKLIDSLESGDEHQWLFNCVLWELDGDYYYFMDYERHDDPESLDFNKAVLVPRSYCQATIVAGIEQAGTLEDPSSIFFKRLIPYGYEPEDIGKKGTMLDHEAKMYEIIKKSPYPRICRYYGYLPTSDGQYIDALCLKKYGRYRDLFEVVWQKHKVDVDAIMEGLADSLNHLHSLGLAHNDLNPGNIVLDCDDLPVIIDFDSCRPIGEEMGGGMRGTFEWTPEPPPKLSLAENDWYGWRRIRDWLAENNPPSIPPNSE